MGVWICSWPWYKGEWGSCHNKIWEETPVDHPSHCLQCKMPSPSGASTRTHESQQVDCQCALDLWREEKLPSSLFPFTEWLDTIWHSRGRYFLCIHVEERCSHPDLLIQISYTNSVSKPEWEAQLCVIRRCLFTRHMPVVSSVREKERR